MTGWVEILTAKQARFFKYFIEKYGLYATTREYSECNVAIKHLNLDCKILGRHGRNVLEKLVYSVERSQELLKWFLDKKPKFLIAHGSVEGSRIAFQAGIPIFDFNDSPESVFVSRLTSALASYMIVPKGCGEEFKKYGAQRVIEYDGLTPVTWLKRHVYDLENVKGLLDDNKTNVLIREPAYLASHIEAPDELFLRLVKELNKISDQINLIVLKRYKGEFLDLPTLLTKTDIVIATGSIVGEAIVSGVPLVIDYLPIVQKMYERFLKEDFFFHAKDLDSIISKIKAFLKVSMNRREPLYNKMEDPLEIFDELIKNEYQHLLT